ncbi:MAG: alanine dehydrogenase [Dehalococcoidia bacterium]|nr:alanine dehydrogenase [Dehalococcoidia bacterium]MDW8120446.1 alanine dehydrogenase [Chloroflexota bacterium]
MRIGVPRERKADEYRVALTPEKVADVRHIGHEVLVEKGAGEGAGFPDAAYLQAGALLTADAAEVWGTADLIVKVKELQPSEYELPHPGQILFTYLHLAAHPEVAHALLRRKVVAIAYETVQLPDGSLPLLMPMSEIAGRMAPLIGAYYLQRPLGGKGKLMAGAPGTRPTVVAVLGAGTAGTNAARVAAGLGAQVVLLDTRPDRLRQAEASIPGRLTTLYSTPTTITESVLQADVVIGAVLVPGAKAPKLITRAMVTAMAPGSVVIDIAVDQGGCVETTRATTHAQPVYTVNGVIHYAVDNMPGAYPQTASSALSNALYPYLRRLLTLGVPRALTDDPALTKGVNIYRGYVTHPAVAEALGLPYTPLSQALASDS